MAQLLEIRKTGDGWDYFVLLASGESHTFHSPTEQADPQAFIDSLEASVEVAPPDPMPADAPVADELQQQRDAAKLATIAYMFAHPDCSQEEAADAGQAVAPLLNGVALMQRYITGSYELGYIPEATFAHFKAFVLSLTPEQLMQL